MMFNEDICSPETGICHVYLVAPEDPMHSMNIIFHSNLNLPINPRIMIGTSPDHLNKIKFGKSKKMENIKDQNRYVTQIYLDNLDPSTLYYFQIQYENKKNDGNDFDDDNNDVNDQSFRVASDVMKFRTFKAASSSSSPESFQKNLNHTFEFMVAGDFGLTAITYQVRLQGNLPFSNFFENLMY
jgi:hypothetical protein